MSVSTAIDLSAVARVVGIETQFKDLRRGNILLLPQRIAVIGQGSLSATYATTKRQVTSAHEAGTLYGFGSPIHLAVKQLLPVNGDGVGTLPVTVYPLTNATTSTVAANGTITPAGTQTKAAAYRVLVNNIPSEEFVINPGDNVATVVAAIVAAVNATLDIPVTATDDSGAKLTLTAKWPGLSGNDLYFEVVGSTTAGMTFGMTQPSGGLINPDVDLALAQIGDVWETLILNCLDIADTATLDKFQTAGDGRWGALVRKPFIVFTGSNAKTVTLATTVSDARKDDRVNSQLIVPDSKDLPFVIAARLLARIGPVANNNPARDYGSQEATGLTAGADGDQWNNAERDSAVKKGSSTIQVRDGVVNLSDTVTFHHPTGDPIPSYRYVVDIIKIMNVIFNLDLIFVNKEWDGAPLIPDHQATSNREARQPKAAVAAINAMIDSLGLEAIISDPELSKKDTVAAISDQNPKRLDVRVLIRLSGNTNIISISLDFGFNFGERQVLA